MADKLIIRIEIGEVIEDHESVKEGDPCQEKQLGDASRHGGNLSRKDCT